MAAADMVAADMVAADMSAAAMEIVPSPCPSPHMLGAVEMVVVVPAAEVVPAAADPVLHLAAVPKPCLSFRASRPCGVAHYTCMYYMHADDRDDTCDPHHAWHARARSLPPRRERCIPHFLKIYPNIII